MKTTIIFLVKHSISDYRAAVVNCKNRIANFVGCRFVEIKTDNCPTLVLNTLLTKEDKDRLQAACLEKDVCILFIESDKDVCLGDTIKIQKTA